MGDEYITFLLENLLENAIVHNMNEVRSVWIDLMKYKKGYKLTISDNGHGLSDEMKRSFFDPHRRFGGVGIHQSMKIIEKYGGLMQIEDRVHGDYTKGTKFTVWFPALC